MFLEGEYTKIKTFERRVYICFISGKLSGQYKQQKDGIQIDLPEAAGFAA